MVISQSEGFLAYIYEMWSSVSVESYLDAWDVFISQSGDLSLQDYELSTNH